MSDRRKQQDYFNEALSNFMFDMASGGAIRHLADRGYSVDQIIKTLEFPTPRDRVEKTVYQHMLDTGMLRTSIGEGDMTVRQIEKMQVYKLNHVLSEYIDKNGEKNSYMLCPFGAWKRADRERYLDKLSCLTKREKEYIMGIRWEQQEMYHILNSRMLEIGVQLTVHSSLDTRFYFLVEGLVLCG